MLLQGAGAQTPSGLHPQVHKSPLVGSGGEAQPGEKPRSSPSRTRGSPPDTPRAGGHLLKDEVLVIGAAIGASWDAPGDPYKGLRGFYSL